MDKLRSVVVGIDFTPGSMAALQQAIRWGKGCNAAIRALHVINTHVVIDLQHALSPLQKNIQGSLESEARRAWESFCRDVTGVDGVQLTIRVGNPVTSLLDEAAADAADLLVLGIHREADAEPGAGSTAAACVRKSKCRVLLVRPENHQPFKRIVACVDFSDASKLAVAEAARVAKLEGGAVEILHVFEPPWKQLHYFAPMPENSPEFQAKYRASIVTRLRDLCEPLKAELEGIPHDFKLDEHQSAGRGIVDYAKKNSVDLIVMATQGRGNIREMFLGSTAERVLRHTPCSMLTVRPTV